MTRTLRLPVLVWLALATATLVSYIFHFGEAYSIDVAGSAVLLIGSLKIIIIGAYYMELRHAPLFLRLIFTVWIVALSSILAILFWLGN